jgi:NADH:ubiquinone oxidoreductase subunit F (NADH-binding)
MDRIRTDITDIIFVFIFLVGFGFEYGQCQPCRIGYDWIVDIINMLFKYSDTDTVSDVEYPDSDTDRSEPL